MDLSPSLARLLPGEFTVTPPLVSLLFTNLITIALAVIGNWDLATVLFIYWAQSVIIGIFTVATLLTLDTKSLAAEAGQAQGAAGGAGAGAGEAEVGESNAGEARAGEKNAGEEKTGGKEGGGATNGDKNGGGNRMKVKTIVIPDQYAWIGKVFLAGFFAVHYGLFHWVYYGFIVEGGLFGPVDFSATGIWFSCALFFFNHLFSFLYHRSGARADAMSITQAFIEPYNRIVPMHMTIIFGSMIALFLEFLGFHSLVPVLVLFLLIKTYLDIRQHVRKHAQQLHPDDPSQFIGL